MDSSTIAPTWLVLPLALIALVVQAGYLIALKELPKVMMPASRRRIRTASSWMSMFAIPMSAYGFGVATTDDPGLFAMVWIVVIALISGILMLAGLDAVNTMRIHRKAKQGLHTEFRQALRLTDTHDGPSNGEHDE